MAKKHVWRVKKEYFRQLKSGEKSIEVRVGYPQIKKTQQGDIVTFENYGANEFDVKRVAVYASFEEMLRSEGVESVLPGMTFNGALKTLRRIYPRDRELLGIYVFELRYRARETVARVIYRASDLLKAEKYKLFSRVVAECYSITDWICKDYPEHCDHFYSKYVPGVFDGTREIVACHIGNKIVAVAILKKDDDERKISTCYVKPEYQKQGIAIELLKVSFDWLGTTKPLITIADYKVEQFADIIKLYAWEQTNVLEPGYYNSHSREIVFNG